LLEIAVSEELALSRGPDEILAAVATGDRQVLEAIGRIRLAVGRHVIVVSHRTLS
jgi:hypothetical protein